MLFVYRGGYYCYTIFIVITEEQNLLGIDGRFHLDSSVWTLLKKRKKKKKTKKKKETGLCCLQEHEKRHYFPTDGGGGRRSEARSTAFTQSSRIFELMIAQRFMRLMN